MRILLTSVRGLLPASVAASLGLAAGWVGFDHGPGGLASATIGAILIWPAVALLSAPGAALLSIPLWMAVSFIRRRVPRGAALLAATALGSMAGIANLFLTLHMLGKSGTPWTDPSWTPWLPGAIPGGMVWGWTLAQDSLEME